MKTDSNAITEHSVPKPHLAIPTPSKIPGTASQITSDQPI